MLRVKNANKSGMLNTFVFYAARKYQESTVLVPKGDARGTAYRNSES